MEGSTTIPGPVESQASGKVRAVFAPNLGIADDKVSLSLYSGHDPIYLGEEPVLENAETFSLAVEDDYRYVMDRFDELVIKSRSGWVARTFS